MRNKPRSVWVGPLLLVLPGCAASFRAGPKVTVADAEPAVEAEATALGGLANDDDLVYMGFPLTVGVGSLTSERRAVAHLESGFEYGSAIGEGPFGFRFGPRVGGALAGPSGVFVGLRGGPRVIFEKRGTSGWLTNLSLEALANMNASGDLQGMPTWGAALTIGSDYYGSFNIPSGRPLRAADRRAVVAPPTLGRAWREPAKPELRGLSAEVREQLGWAWLSDAQLEHASIATFGALASELLSFGAPPELVEGAHRAALDEARHARLCFALASVYLATDLDPAELPVEHAVPAAGYESMAAASLIEGCFGEGLAASLARTRARRCTDPAVRRVLGVIARDEARHAKLGWEVLRFALSRCGDAAAARTAETWERFDPLGNIEPVAWPDLPRLGTMTDDDVQRATRRTHRRVASAFEAQCRYAKRDAAGRPERSA